MKSRSLNKHMGHFLKNKVQKILKTTDERSVKALKNIFFSFGVRGASILIGLILIPLTITYINPVQYGIWLTISSVVSWMSFFDIGLGNGLRNKVAISLAHNNYQQARIYISTTYGFLSIISIILIALFYIVNPLINWHVFLNIPLTMTINIHLLIAIVFFSFLIQFVVQIVNTVLTAVHEPALAGFFSFLGQLLVLIAIIVLRRTTKADLIILVSTLALTPIVVLTISSFILYLTRLKNIAPSVKLVDFKQINGLLNTGGAFFFIQIGAIVLLQTDNIVITKVINPQAVTEFNVVYKLFSVIIMIFNIIMTPYWSAFTDAFAKNDFVWMKHTLFNIRRIWIGISIIVVPITCALSSKIFNVWIGRSVNIPAALSWNMGIYTIGYTGLMLNCFFLNGVGKLRVQLLLYIAVCLINIPLSILLGKMYGTSGITFSNTLMFMFMGTVLWIQSDKILNRKAVGVWSK